RWQCREEDGGVGEGADVSQERDESLAASLSASQWIRAAFAGAVALCVLAGVGMLALATRHGVGLGSDSALYLAAAGNWLRGLGLSWVRGGGEATLVTHYPPLYSLLLAGLQMLRVPQLDAARAVNLTFFAVSGIAVGALAARLTGSRMLGLVGLGLFLFCGEVIQVHSWAMSEALYIGLASIGAVVVSLYLRNRRAWSLVAAAVALALATMTRYVGLSLPLAAALAIASDDLGVRSRPLRNAGIFLALSMAPAVLWLGWSAVWAGSPGGRVPGWSLAILPELARQVTSTVLNWFLPLRLVRLLDAFPPAGVMLAAAALACLLALWLVRRGRLVRGDHSISHGEVLLPNLWALLHIGGLLAAAVFTFPETHVNERTLSPAYPFLVIALLVLAGSLWRSRKWLLRAMLVAAIFLLIRNKVVYAYWVVHGLQQDGQRYASAAWRASPTIAALRELEPPLIYTDDIAAVYLLAERYSYNIPRRLDAITGEPLHTYPADLETMRQRITSQGGVLVLFDLQHIPADMAPPEDLTAGLCPLQSLPDGVIYAACPTASGE
ncbi:MAG: hypothetical protein ACUVX9_19265, partial [Anaerolineae bacterium]